MGFFTSKTEENTLKEAVPEKRLYLIDFENTQDSGILGISALTKNDELVVFYGATNNTISFTSHEMIVLANCKVTLKKCEKAAKNYLDFQLVSYLGKRLGRESFAEVVIVSKDLGFESVVDFWSSEGVNIVRQAAIDPSVKMPEPAPKPERKRPAKAPKKAQEKPPVKKPVPQKPASQQPAPVKPAEPASEKPAEKKPEVKKERPTVSSIPESIKKKIRNALKTEGLKPTQYTLIYKALISCKTQDDYKNHLTKRLADHSDSVYEKTVATFNEYKKLI